GKATAWGPGAGLFAPNPPPAPGLGSARPAVTLKKGRAYLNGSHGYPRPQLERAEWFDLTGEWEFALDPEAVWKLPDEPDWNARIRVPFSPETPASGIGNAGFFRACWHGRQFDAPKLNPGERLLLHFCAVDFRARVWVNGKLAVEHEGGYTPFCADITQHLRESGPQIVTVWAH